MGKWRRNKSLKRRWERSALINKYGAICYLCGQPFQSMKDITIDHWLPFAKGGIDEFSNLRLAHLECNQEKSNMTPEEFLEFQKGGDKVE